MNTFTNLNISTLNTSYETLAEKAQAGRQISYEDYAQKIMETLYQAIDNRDHLQALEETLSTFENLIRFEIPLDIRPLLFRKLNDLLSHMYLTVGEDQSLRSLFLNVLTIVKTQIDQQEQNDFTASEQEWDELQRSVFILGEWEDQR